MEVVTDLEVRSDPSGWPLFGRRHAAALGVFDGVHVGHQAIIDQARQAAQRTSAGLAVVTFDPHPAVVLRPEMAPATLTGFDHKLELLEGLGVDTVVVVKFDQDRSEEEAGDFVAAVLAGALGITYIVVGSDFHFGRDRKGDVSLLTELGPQYDFQVHGRPLSLQDDLMSGGGADPDCGPEVTSRMSSGDPISSTAIRNAIAEGDVELARALLGRPHQVRGTVVQGDQRGRTIGFPTANIAVPSGVAVPGDGVYAGWWTALSAPDDGSVPRRWPCAINVGKRPTFYQDAEHSVIEAHLIDWQGDLYGVAGGIEFVTRLRAERKFDGLDALKAQLVTDVDAARNCLTT